MAYLKVLLSAVFGAVAGAVLWIMVGLVLPVAAPMLLDRLIGRGGGSAAVIGSGSIILAALAGLIIAGTWAIRRFVSTA